jgi:uncharacterized protein (DUF433 family)
VTSTLEIPIHQNADGAMLVGSTRVTLDTVVAAFQLGAAAEEIALRYSLLKLADVYAAIGYYLQHQAEVEEYLQQRQQSAAEVCWQNESHFASNGIRSRLLARRIKNDQ